MTVNRRKKEEGRGKKAEGRGQKAEGKRNCDIMFFGAIESYGTYFAWLLSVLRVSINGLCFEF
jgi:hypothetical protein